MIRTWQSQQAGTIVDHGTERHQRISRTNRSGNKIHYSAAVTDSPDGGVMLPTTQEQRILGFAVQLTEDDIDCERICLPNRGFYAPGDAVCISLNERIRAIAVCDVLPGDAVIVEPEVGLPAAIGIKVKGATWESITMAGELGVIQINTRAAR